MKKVFLATLLSLTMVFGVGCPSSKTPDTVTLDGQPVTHQPTLTFAQVVNDLKERADSVLREMRRLHQEEIITDEQYAGFLLLDITFTLQADHLEKGVVEYERTRSALALEALSSRMAVVYAAFTAAINYAARIKAGREENK